jgi:aromatic ring-opening dioxygenase catalytic subunit (LigB family)
MPTQRQPSIFLPHGGGPCFFMEWTMGPPDTWDKTRTFLEAVSSSLPERPSAIVVVSGHWEEPVPTVSTAEHPALIYDYYGFPAETYQLKWPSPGSREVATKIAERLRTSGLPVADDPTRGFDHGVFVPLKVAFPEAEIPVVPLSLAGSLDPALHLAVGRALAPLRDEGVLVIGSGMSFHNLRAYFQQGTLEKSAEFDRWLHEAVSRPAPERDGQLRRWRDAPSALFAQPREDHLIPLMVAAGAGGDAEGRRVFQDAPMGAVISAWRWD